MIDTHCHLNFHSFKKDYRETAEAANTLGVTKIINVGAKLDSSRRAVKIANEIPFCFAAVGVHPHHAEEMIDSSWSLPRMKLLGWNDPPSLASGKLRKGKQNQNTDISFLKVEKELTEMIEENLKNNKKIVAIGECGLDYHEYVNNNPTVETLHATSLQEKNVTQKKLLELHFKLSQKYSLPLIIHCRDAYSDLIDLLQTFGMSSGRMPANCNLLTGTIHCFQGNLDELKQFLSLGFYIGYDGYITYGDKSQDPNSKSQINFKFQNSKQKNDIRKNPLEISKNPGEEKQEELTHYELLVKNTPLNRILTETDSPWLTPEPLRGTRNSPANIKIITEKIAEIKKISFEEVDKITTENAEKLFNI